MTRADHPLVHDFFEAVTNGNLPDSLLTPDVEFWTTMSGTTDKASYQGMVKLLAAMCARPLAFTIHSITAEADRVAVEAESEGELINGEIYRNTYVFVLRIRDDRIASIAEHFNPLVVQEKLLPLMKTVRA